VKGTTAIARWNAYGQTRAIIAVLTGAAALVLLRSVLRIPLRMPGHSAVFVLPILALSGRMAAAPLSVGITGTLAGFASMLTGFGGIAQGRPGAALSLFITAWVLELFGLVARGAGAGQARPGEAETGGILTYVKSFGLFAAAGIAANGILGVLHGIGVGPFHLSNWYSPMQVVGLYLVFGLVGGIVSFVCVMPRRRSDDAVADAQNVA